MNCCLNCLDRHLGCHSDCTRYIEAKKLHEEEKEKIRVAKMISGIYHCVGAPAYGDNERRTVKPYYYYARGRR